LLIDSVAWTRALRHRVATDFHIAIASLTLRQSQRRFALSDCHTVLLCPPRKSIDIEMTILTSLSGHCQAMCRDANKPFQNKRMPRMDRVQPMRATTKREFSVIKQKKHDVQTANRMDGQTETNASE
jgi:hypothetical protein